MKGGDQRFRLAVLGFIGSGKTTFLTALWDSCGRKVEPPECGEYFEKIVRYLSAGTAPESTRHERECHFRIANRRKTLIIETKDYPGELTVSLNKEAGGGETQDFRLPNLKRDLQAADAVLFLVDSYQLARDGGWQRWARDKTHVLNWIKNYAAEGGLPITILLTRADLVEENLLDTLLREAESEAKTLGKNVKVETFRAFTNKTGTQVQRSQVALDAEFLAPKGKLSPKPRPDRIVRSLYQRREESERPGLKAWLCLVLPVVVLFFGFAFIYNSYFRQTLGDELCNIVEKAPGTWPEFVNEDSIKKVSGGRYVPSSKGETIPPLSRIIRRYLPDLEDAASRKRVERAYLDKVVPLVEQLSKALAYKASEGVWWPEDKARCVAALEDDLKLLGDRDNLRKVQQVKKAKLDRVRTEGLSEAQTEQLVRAYQQIGEQPRPDVLKRYTSSVYQRCLSQAASALKRAAAAGDPKDIGRVYEDELLRILDTVLSSQQAIAPGARKKLEDARRYLTLLRAVRERGEINLRFDAFTWKGPHSWFATDTFEPGFCIEVELSGVHQYYNPISGTRKQSKAGEGCIWDKILSECGDGECSFPDNAEVNLPWDYACRITIRVKDFHRRNEELVTWDSKALERANEADGWQYLPGLTFMVFWQAYESGGKGKSREDHTYWLKLRDPDQYKLFRIPEFLKEANKKRRQG